MTTNINERVAVENIQRYLRQLSLYDDTMPRIAIDGIYGDETRAAIYAFQQLAGLMAKAE